MGLQKQLKYDHTKGSLCEAVGYSLDTVQRELEPGAALLADRIVDEAGMCPTMAVELLMDSSILLDSMLDDRDRAMIVLMAGPWSLHDHRTGCVRSSCLASLPVISTVLACGPFSPSSCV